MPNQVSGVAESLGLTRGDVDRAAWTVDGRGRKLSGAAAANAVLAELGGRWRLVAAFGRLPVVSQLEELVYRWVANHREWASRRWGVTPECEQPDVRCI